MEMHDVKNNLNLLSKNSKRIYVLEDYMLIC